MQTRPFRRRRMQLALASGAAGLLLFAGYCGVLWLSGNFHPVLAGELYRSGQLSPGQLADYAARYGIRTVVNLRGQNTGRPWYDAEIRESERLGLKHLDFRMSASRILAPERAAELVALLRSAEKPVLLHCEGGADRSGLASALYLAAVAKTSEARAEGQLSPLFGHIPIPLLSRAFAMDETFELLEPSLGFPDS